MLRVLQKSYYGKVKMIYIDPPYNTGNDSFVYREGRSCFRPSCARLGAIAAEGAELLANASPADLGRFCE